MKLFKVISVVVLLQSTSVSFAESCPNLAGKFEAKVGPVLNTIEVKQTGCESFEMTTTNSAGLLIRKTFVPDGIERTIYHDGRKVQTAAATIEDIRVGTRTITTLRVDVVEIDRYLETKVREENHFYTESDGNTKGLIERKDIFDADDEKVGRIYIGYINSDHQ